jgi:hypothetical protein
MSASTRTIEAPAAAGEGRARRLILFGTPLALGLVTLVHPVVRRSPAVELQGQVGLWLGVHLLQLALLCLLAVTMWLLVDGLPGRAASVSRAALLPFVAFYGAFDALVGIATGQMVRKAAQLPQAAVTADVLWAGRLHDPLVGAVVLPAALAWLTASLAAALALARAGAPRSGVAALVLAGLLLAVDHAPPFGPLAMLWLLIAVVVLERRPARGAARVAAASEAG